MHLLSESGTHLVSVPVLDYSVLADSPKIVAPLFMLKSNLHDAFLMRKYGLVTISKVKTPYFDIFVCRTCDNQFRVQRNVHRENGKLQTAPSIPA